MTINNYGVGIIMAITKTQAQHFVSGVLLGLVLVFPATSTVAAPGDITDNSGLIPFDQAYFAFEVEGPVGTLKEVPIWDELEQMLDNPYQFAYEPDVLGNFQGWPSYRSTQQRRRSYIYRNGGQPCAPGSSGCSEVQLSGHIIHPLNYNFQGGEELRLLNRGFRGADWWVTKPDRFNPDDPTGGTEGFIVSDPCTDPDCTPGQIKYEYYLDMISVSRGRTRVEPGEASIDYNSPMAPDDWICVTTVEPIPPPEASRLCGGDVGEPGYLGFGVRGTAAQRRNQYSMPAVPGKTGPGDRLTGRDRLRDPDRGVIRPRNGQGARGLNKPSLRIPDAGGSPAAPNYLVNAADSLAVDPAALMPSNENDYYAGATRPQKLAAREAAMALGKALFWDMQVGSDSVQACASCHFHAGVDNRTKGQLTSNTEGGDLTTISAVGLVGGISAGPNSGANASVTAATFPLHKLNNFAIPTDPLVNPNNIARTTNDVVSSMGVSRFTEFVDIPAINTFLPATNGVQSLPPDIGHSVTDPFPINNGFRRVEPRHTPTFFAATMNFDNFWDGRARHDFNGGSVFGASDPQSHVMVDNNGSLAATRQVIRFASLASLATGPALSENEMSFAGRNWAKLGKRLLQNGVTPLANQLVDVDDSVMGLYSNQGGSACGGLPAADRSGNGTPTSVGKPGLCISYPGLIRRAFYSALWQNTSMHLNGCYTDNRPDLHANQCANNTVAIPVLNNAGTAVVNSSADPFDNYVLSIAGGAAAPTDRDQFTQMEANMSLFFGLSVHAWGTILLPDDTPFDRFMDGNPDAFISFGEANEVALVIDLDTCAHTNNVQPCFREVGNFKRDPNVVAKLDCPGPEGPAGCTFKAAGGSRSPGTVDPLLGLDFFLGSNLSLKNPNYNTLRCGECHAGGTLTDHTVEISHQVSFNDWAQEFAPGMPGQEIFPEPLGRGRIISGFALEGEINGNAQDAVERNLADFCTIEPCRDAYGNAVPGGVAGGFPQGQALFDNGVYNIGVTPIGDDRSRGGKDAFGWPLSLSVLAFKNLCGVGYSPGGDNPLNNFAQPGSNGNPGNACPRFDPDPDSINPFTGEEGDPTGGGLYETTAQDQQINPGFEEEVGEEIAQLPPYLAPWASNLNVGDEVQIDEVFVGVNTRMREPMLEGFIDSFGPFNPAAVLGENMNNAVGAQMATWPNVNRVNRQGAFKAAPLRNVELTNPYFHDGGNLTLRQQLDFYMRGGNFPVTNKAHRDFLIMNLLNEDEALGGFVDPTTCNVNAPLGSQDRASCIVVAPGTAGAVPNFSAAEKEQIIVSVVDYLLELTDERVAFERAPFDHPEIFVPIDARASENVAGRGTTAATGGYTLIGQTGVGCTTPLAGRSLTAGVPDVTLSDGGPATAGPTCFRQVPAVGAGGNPTKLPNFLDVQSPRKVDGSFDLSVRNNPNCDPASGPISHYCH
jgi:cytochrome c peroxidase